MPSTLSDNGGSAARYFYCAKANTKDRDEGLDHLPEVAAAGLPMRSADGERGGEGLDGTSTDRLTKRRNTHPTVKPTSLMQYLCRLVTPPNGVVLDPFCGSGSTGKAAMLEGFRFVGIDLDATYTTIANARCEHAAKKSDTEKLTDTESASIVQLNLLDGL
jgi:site-specific DNA-methyltransferase (adenine-specific)